MEKRKEITYISFLQFIGPIFVILGHSLNGIASQGIWWMFTKQWIYIFHMPLFFMISGYLLSYRNWMNGKSYGIFIKAKFYRLIIPYLVWNVICFLPKLLLQNFLADEVDFNIGYIIKIFISPRQNIWGHTWFLVGLFLVYLLTALWQKMFMHMNVGKWIAFAVIGGVLYLLPLNTEIFCISDLHKDLLFFWMGCWLGTIEPNRMKQSFQKNRVLIVAVAAVLSGVCLCFYNLECLKLLTCTAILAALLCLALIIESNPPLIQKLSQRSFGIYIMHWPVMLCCRVVLLQVLECNPAVTVVAMIICGYLVPNVVIEILQKIPLGKLKKPIGYLLGA